LVHIIIVISFCRGVGVVIQRVVYRFITGENW
jgi:hypothetical protein